MNEEAIKKHEMPGRKSDEELGKFSLPEKVEYLLQVVAPYLETLKTEISAVQKRMEDIVREEKEIPESFSDEISSLRAALRENVTQYAMPCGSWKIKELAPVCELKSEVKVGLERLSAYKEELHIPERFKKRITEELEKIFSGYNPQQIELEAETREICKRNGQCYAEESFKWSEYVYKVAANNRNDRERKLLKLEAIWEYCSTPGIEVNNEGVKKYGEMLDEIYFLDWLSETLSERQIRESICDAKLYLALLKGDSEGIRLARIEKIHYEGRMNKADENENNVSFEVQFQDPKDKDHYYSLSGVPYPMSIDLKSFYKKGFEKDYRLNKDTNERFKFILKVEVENTTRKLCWEDYEDLCAYFEFQFINPLAKEHNENQLPTKKDILKFSREIMEHTSQEGEGVKTVVKESEERGAAHRDQTSKEIMEHTSQEGEKVQEQIDKGLNQMGVNLNEARKEAAMNQEETLRVFIQNIEKYKELSSKIKKKKTLVIDLIQTYQKEEGNYRKTAQEMGMSKTTVSSWIKQIENALGFPLVYRTNKKDFNEDCQAQRSALRSGKTPKRGGNWNS